MNSFKLRASFFALIFAYSCIFFGCGSDNSAGISSRGKEQKPPGKQKSQVVELLIDGPPGKGGTTKPGIPRKMGSPNLEVIPHDTPDGRSISQQEISAALRASKQIDPQLIEIIPPRKPGENGLTQRQVDVLKSAQGVIDPQSMEVIPPKIPGERGLTQRQVDALKSAQGVIDPQSMEVVPPKIPGGRGATVQEINEIRASLKESLNDDPKLIPLPPTRK